MLCYVNFFTKAFRGDSFLIEIFEAGYSFCFPISHFQITFVPAEIGMHLIHENY